MCLPTRVAIALVSRRGCYLVRQRPDAPGSPMPGYWEFPGGKCENGETAAQAAVRECWEEASLRVAVAGLRRVITHRYPHGLVELHYLDCTLERHGVEPAAGSHFRWVPAGDLPGMMFPEANEPILHELANENSA